MMLPPVRRKAFASQRQARARLAEPSAFDDIPRNSSRGKRHTGHRN